MAVLVKAIRFAVGRRVEMTPDMFERLRARTATTLAAARTTAYDGDHAARVERACLERAAVLREAVWAAADEHLADQAAEAEERAEAFTEGVRLAFAGSVAADVTRALLDGRW